MPRDAHAAGQCLHNNIVSRAVGHWSAIAESRQRAVDDLRINLLDVFEVEFKLGANARPKILDNDVRPFDQLEQLRAIFLRLQIDDDRTLAAIHRLVVQAHIRIVEMREMPGLVALCRLYLDHLCTKIGQHHRAQRASQHTGKIDDALPRQRTRCSYTSYHVFHFPVNFGGRFSRKERTPS